MRIDRVKMLEAMKLLALTVNNRKALERWLMLGLPNDDTHLSDYCSDEEFLDIVHEFLIAMKRSGGLHI